MGLYQTGLLSCFLRSAPNLEALKCAVGGSQDAFKAAKDFLEPANLSLLRSVIDTGVTRCKDLECMLAKRDALQFPRPGDIENTLKRILDVAPLVDFMEPLLVRMLPNILRTRDVDHLSAVAKIAWQHSMLRLPI